MKAVIPAAGLGTRFLPLTKAQPKEMLPVVNKPTIQWVVEEAIDAGITEIAIITGRYKQAIKRHFTPSPELERALAKAGKNKELEQIQKVSEMANIEFIIQEEQKGLGHAVLCAENFVGNSPFAVLLGDTICVGEPNCTRGLVEKFKTINKSIFAVEQIELEETRRYGVVSGNAIKKDLWEVKNLVEKPEPQHAPSQLGILGRYIFTPDIFEYQRSTKLGVGGEIQLTDAMRSLAEEDIIYAWLFNGRRYDIGTMRDWFKSHIELSSESEFADVMDEIMREI
jgi:UTP--glucose-1-phosphate uridylyltransferase